METFTWQLDRQPRKRTKPDVKVIKFGDSYESRISSGMNRPQSSWAVSFNNRLVAEINSIEDFLEARGGVEAFEWTPPNSSTAIVVVCREWERVEVSSTYASLTTTFERVFEAP